ncbi:DHH family phosphoesterase [Inediibacterium massiliense]|uniref:DHH family phosphoesterase n=1 Tax=Inediibacterium massiliense TaxID=1658111 RepID=UPI0006B5AC61|nr:bifunctional oligoribonuclease/PAP phosphatase NrnA [Inediibacterium massiliense]
MNKNDALNCILEVIDKSNKIIILPHILPDGDTIGASMALCLALKEMKKDPYILLDEEIPSNIQFLNYVKIYKNLPEYFEYDLVISVDCSDVDRLGERVKWIKNDINSLNIDHHITNTYFARYNMVYSDAAATAEVIYDLIKDFKISMTKEIATCLYTGLSTDTGSFKYDNTSSQTHRIAASLLENHIDLNFINTQLYQNKPLYKVKLLGDVLNTLSFYFNDRVAVLSITQDILKKHNARVEDIDGFIEYARDIQGVEVGILLKEMNECEIKVGFRSKYNVDVSKIAQNFHGGGHKKASGCTIYDHIDCAKQQVIEVVKNYL